MKLFLGFLKTFWSNCDLNIGPCDQLTLAIQLGLPKFLFTFRPVTYVRLAGLMLFINRQYHLKNTHCFKF